MLETFTVNSWTVLLMAALWFAAFITGKGLANTWRPIWQVFLYCGFLGFADRFLVFALYQGPLLSLTRFVIDTAVLIAISLFAFRMTTASKMVNQYPWLYEATGILTWREKTDSPGKGPGTS